MTTAQATARARIFVRDQATPFYYLIDDIGLTTRLGLNTQAPDGTPASISATFVLDGAGTVHFRDIREQPQRWLTPGAILDAVDRLS